MQTYIVCRWAVNWFSTERVIAVVCALISALFLPAGAGQEPVKGKEQKIDLVKVKIKDLVDTHIAAHKGKVVVINVWAWYSAPDKVAFVEFIKLHQMYVDKGLICMSINVDPNEEFRKRALKFLQDKNANFTNYWVDGNGIDEAQRQWQFEPTPAVIIYGRDGKLAKVFKLDDPNKEPFTVKDAEEFVKRKLLEK